MSTCDMIQPPKMSPCWFVSCGIGTTRSTGSLSGSSTLIAGARWRVRPSRGLLLLVAQLAPQDLPDVGLRKLGAELDVARALVARQVLPAVRQQLLRAD